MFKETEFFKTNLTFRELIERTKNISEEWQELFSNIDGKDLCYRVEKSIIFLRYYSGHSRYMPIVKIYFSSNHNELIVQYQVTFFNVFFSSIFLLVGVFILLLVIFTIVPALKWHQAIFFIAGLMVYSIGPMAFCVGLFYYYLPKYKNKVRQILNIQNGV